LARRTAALFIGAILSWNTCASGQAINESTAKIQFLHYLAQYAVWPQEVLSAQDKTFALGVLGENPFGETLENYFKGKTVKGRRFVIKFFKTAQEAKACHMLFIPCSEKSNYATFLKQLEDASVLTISDCDGFLQKEGMIFIYIAEKTEITGGLGWDINSDAMKKAKLQIDPFFIEKARKYNR